MSAVAVVGVFLALAYLIVLAQTYRGALKVFRQMSTAWDTPLEYLPIESGDPTIPLKGYDDVEGELTRLGFRRVGRVQDVPMTKAYPELRTFLEIFVSDVGKIYAASYRMVAAPFAQQVVDFETQFEDGGFLVTTNGLATGFLEQAPAIERNARRGEDHLVELLQAHQRRLDEQDGRAIRLVHTQADILRAQGVFRELERRHRQSVGHLTFEELRRMAGGRLFLPGSLRLFYWVFRSQVRSHRLPAAGSR